jgi:hypothetical protein
MSESNTNRNVRDDEIDLLDLFRRMGSTFSRWANSIGRAFLITIVFLLKKWLPLSLSVLLGVGASVIVKMTSDSFYTSDLVLRNNLVSNADMISYLNRLHTYSIEQNSVALCDAISVTPQQVNNIIDINAFWIIDQMNDGTPDYVDYRGNHNVYDTINVRMTDRLALRVKIKVPQELSLLRDGIISFIERDSLFQQRNRVRTKQNFELLARLNYDIVQLDSLQKIKYFEETKSRQPLGGGQMIFLQEQKTQLIYTDIYQLYTRKQILEGEIDLYKGIVTVFSDFSLPAIRDNGTLYYAKQIIPLFFCLALIVLILLANRKRIKEIYEKY